MSSPFVDENRRSAPWSWRSKRQSRTRASSNEEYSARPPTSFVRQREAPRKPAMSRVQSLNEESWNVVALKLAPDRLQRTKWHSSNLLPEKLICSIRQSSNRISLSVDGRQIPHRKSPFAVVPE